MAGRHAWKLYSDGLLTLGGLVGEAGPVQCKLIEEKNGWKKIFNLRKGGTSGWDGSKGK